MSEIETYSWQGLIDHANQVEQRERQELIERDSAVGQEDK